MNQYAHAGDCRIAYTTEGPDSAPALVLSNSIGTTRELWNAQVPAFSGRFRVITYDTRGHGASDVPPGDYTIERLARDVLAILDAERVARAHVCGLSLGGITAMWLGIHAPERIAKLVLANTAARAGTVQSWTDRIALVRSSGMAPVADRAMQLWFSAAFKERHPDVVERYRTMVAACSPDGYIGCCAALRDNDLRENVAQIQRPTLVIGGTQDQSTTIDAAEFLRSRIPGARLVTFDTAHLSNVEQADAFNEAVLGHLTA